MKNMKIGIVGGGASGMMAAIAAKRAGADVNIFERNPRVGKKILATGNGRCNYTNIYADVENYHGENPKFIYSIFSKFGVPETMDFFEKLGITPAIEEYSKVFPMSFQASSVLDVLRFELEEIGVEVICDAYVKDIEKRKEDFSIVLRDGRIYKEDRVIIATGGKAMPSTGSDGNGYDLAKKFGHKIVDVFPGLVQLKLAGDFFNRIDGVKIVGTAALMKDDKFIKEYRGDVLFTNYGISGPPILQLSREAIELINKGEKPYIKVSIIDSMNKDELNEYLRKRFSYMPKKTLEVGLIGLINKRLIPVILKEAGIKDINKNIGNVTNEEIDKIATILTDWRFEIIGSKSWPSAQVTAGGVATCEIDQYTLESKLVKGLYFAGEIVDIDGDCGGFNLQWAWSSGYVAGENAAK
jgi:predicted Rossmann fold flavoprotein